MMQALPIAMAAFLSTSDIFSLSLPLYKGHLTVTPIGPAILRNGSYLQMEPISTTIPRLERVAGMPPRHGLHRLFGPQICQGHTWQQIERCNQSGHIMYTVAAIIMSRG
jgi:hypothetical protein